MAPLKDVDLLRLFFQRDHYAVTQVYRKHFETCNKYALSITKELDEHEIRDLFHQTLVALEQKQYNPEFQLTSQLSTFIIGIFINKMKKYLDKKRKRPETSSDLPGVSGKEDSNPRQDCLAEALVMMKKDKEGLECYERLEKVYVQGFDQEELAVEFGVTYGGFRNQLSKCVKKLRALAKTLCPECYS